MTSACPTLSFPSTHAAEVAGSDDTAAAVVVALLAAAPVMPWSRNHPVIDVAPLLSHSLCSSNTATAAASFACTTDSTRTTAAIACSSAGMASLLAASSSSATVPNIRSMILTQPWHGKEKFNNYKGFL